MKRTLFLAAILLMFSPGCSRKAIYSTSVSDRCNFKETAISIESLSSNPLELSNLELRDYKENDYEYDILVNSISGVGRHHKLDRWFKNKEGKWMHVKISNDNRVEEEVFYDEDEIALLFDRFEAKSCLKFCECFDCTASILLFKKDKTFFKYSAENGLFDLEERDKQQIAKYQDIYKFFTGI